MNICYQPPVSSWPNVVDRALGVPTRQLRDRSIADQPTLDRGMAAPETDRDEAGSGVDLQSTTANARARAGCTGA